MTGPRPASATAPPAENHLVPPEKPLQDRDGRPFSSPGGGRRRRAAAPPRPFGLRPCPPPHDRHCRRKSNVLSLLRVWKLPLCQLRFAPGRGPCVPQPVPDVRGHGKPRKSDHTPGMSGAASSAPRAHSRLGQAGGVAVGAVSEFRLPWRVYLPGVLGGLALGVEETSGCDPRGRLVWERLFCNAG